MAYATTKTCLIKLIHGTGLGAWDTPRYRLLLRGWYVTSSPT
jgi:hypothetical protein